MTRLGRSYPVQRIWKPPVKAAAAAVLAYDALGSGNVASSFLTSITWTHTATAGAEVLVFAGTALSTISSVTYGASAMTLVGSVADPLNSTGVLYCYKLASAPGGSQTVTVTSASGDFVVGNSVSATGVSTVGSPATVSGVGSQSVSCTAGQLIVQAFFPDIENEGGTGITASSGGTARWTYTASSNQMTISTATASTTFTETDNNASHYTVGLSVVLS